MREGNPVVKVNSLGGWGYTILLLLSLVTLTISFANISLGIAESVLILVVSIVGVIMVGIAWYMLGCRIKDGLMKLYGILAIGWVILSVSATIGVAGAMYVLLVGGAESVSILLMLILALVPFGMFLVVQSKVENGPVKTIVMGLLGLWVISVFLMFAVSIIGVLLTISFVGLLIITIALEIRNLFAAGSKLGEGCFRSAGWFRLISILSLVVAIALLISVVGWIGAYGGFGAIPGSVSATVLGMLGAARWISIGSAAFGIIATTFAAAAFFSASIPESKEAVPRSETSDIY